MNIPANILIEQMEEEMKKLKANILNEETSPTSYHDQVIAIKSFCDILLASERTSSAPKAPVVKHATVADVKTNKSGAKGDRLSIYDPDEEPKSNSLLDF
ncbi:DUF5327 family protein [Evansella tamaricis]|uniref:YwdI family protein n=1 Tax=Evansella tamaricis TaxID=2069301 RepID=A0ABS6JEI3_9BACI|nr:YwdI family protein [Evansella tamaricis]